MSLTPEQIQEEIMYMERQASYDDWGGESARIHLRLVNALREQLSAKDARIAELESRLAECLRISGAESEHHDTLDAGLAVRAVTALRRDYDEACAELEARDIEIAAKEQALREAEERNKRSICVYCGSVQQLDDPANLVSVMSAHIVACERHPMNRVVGLMAAIEELLEVSHGCTRCFVLAGALAKQVEGLKAKAKG